MLVNVGRGRACRERGFDAVLDALWPEPLPPESALWSHPKVTVMPHVTRRPAVRQLVIEIAKKHPQHRSGRPVAGAGRYRT